MISRRRVLETMAAALASARPWASAARPTAGQAPPAAQPSTLTGPGVALYPYLFYARNPAYFRAAKAMWAALQQETRRVPVTLRALLNRRVASWNGCEF